MDGILLKDKRSNQHAADIRKLVAKYAKELS